MRNPLSLEAFADWCEKQPADKEYNYWDCCGCACAQYRNFLGLDGNHGDGLRAGLDNRSGFWWTADGYAGDGPSTFGDLASRLRSGK